MARVKASTSTSTTSGKAVMKAKKGGNPRKKSVIEKQPLSGKGRGKIVKQRRSEKDSEKEKKKEKKARKFKPDTVGRRQCNLYQTGKKSTDLLIQKRPFQRLAREIFDDVSMINGGLRIQGEALLMAQDGMESIMISMVRDSIPILKVANKKSITAEFLREGARRHFKNNALPSPAESS